MAVTPADILPLSEYGSGSMGSVTAASNNYVARAVHPASRYSIAYVVVDFLTGTGSATASLKVDGGGGTTYDRTVQTFPGVGGGTTGVAWRLEPWEYKFFTFGESDAVVGKDILVLEWTDPGTSTWRIRWGLFDASLIDG